MNFAPSRKSVRRAAVILVVALASVITPSAVAAEGSTSPPPAPDGVTVLGQFGRKTAFTAPLGRLYGVGQSGFVAFAGDRVEEVCNPEGSPPETLGVTWQRRNGTWINQIPFGGVHRTVYVYEVQPGVTVFDFLDATCPLIGAGGTPPEPFASGPVVQKAKQWDLANPYWTFPGEQPPGRYRNSIRGHVTDGNGDGYWIVAKADFRVNEDAPPTFFTNSLSVRGRNR